MLAVHVALGIAAAGVGVALLLATLQLLEVAVWPGLWALLVSFALWKPTMRVRAALDAVFSADQPVRVTLMAPLRIAFGWMADVLRHAQIAYLRLTWKLYVTRLRQLRRVLAKWLPRGVLNHTIRGIAFGLWAFPFAEFAVSDDDDIVAKVERAAATYEARDEGAGEPADATDAPRGIASMSRMSMRSMTSHTTHASYYAPAGARALAAASARRGDRPPPRVDPIGIDASAPHPAMQLEYAGETRGNGAAAAPPPSRALTVPRVRFGSAELGPEAVALQQEVLSPRVPSVVNAFARAPPKPASGMEEPSPGSAQSSGAGSRSQLEAGLDVAADVGGVAVAAVAEMTRPSSTISIYWLALGAAYAIMYGLPPLWWLLREHWRLTGAGVALFFWGATAINVLSYVPTMALFKDSYNGVVSTVIGVRDRAADALGSVWPLRVAAACCSASVHGVTVASTAARRAACRSMRPWAPGLAAGIVYGGAVAAVITLLVVSGIRVSLEVVDVGMRTRYGPGRAGSRTCICQRACSLAHSQVIGRAPGACIA